GEDLARLQGAVRRPLGRDRGLQELKPARDQAPPACSPAARRGPVCMSRALAALPKIAVTALIILAITNLLIGVILRYFITALTDYLDLDPIPFTWVEEVGEMSLAWLTLIGAAIGVRQRSHFTLYVFTHQLPQSVQTWISRFNHVLIVGVGCLAAGYGYK